MKVLTAILVSITLLFSAGCSLTIGTPKDDVAVVQQQYDELVKPIVRIKGSAQLPDGRTARWTGSGVIVYSQPNEIGAGFDTYILTCNHVVEVPIFDKSASSESTGPWGPTAKVTGFKYEVEYVEIFNPDGTSRKVGGQVVLQSNNNVFLQNKDGDIVVETGDVTDEETGQKAGEDLALVRLNTVENLPQVKMMQKSDIDKLRVFFKARVVGCSLGGRPYHTFGEITVLQNGYMSVNAQFVPGNSGGAAYLDSTHEFIGITNAGPNPVWHMGLIRPLQRIYAWMDKGGYTFIYDKLFDTDKRLQVLRADRDRPVVAQEQQIKELSSKTDILIARFLQLVEVVRGQDKSIADLRTQCDVLQKSIQDITKTLEDISKCAVPPEIIEELSGKLNATNLAILNIIETINKSKNPGDSPQSKQTLDF